MRLYGLHDPSFRQDARNTKVPSPPIISPDGKRVAYTRYGGKGSELVINGAVYDSAPDIKDIVFSADSSHVAYRVYTQIGTVGQGGTIASSASYVALDAQPISSIRYQDVFMPTFSPKGKDIVFIARREEGKSFVVLNGREQKPYDEITDLYFSPDGNYVGYGARETRELLWVTERLK